MDEWQRDFASRIGALQEQWAARFTTLIESTAEPVSREFAEFLKPWNFRISAPRAESMLRSFKFELAEDAYVLIFFRGKGIDAVECEYESSVPGTGSAHGERTERPGREADREWVESCFQRALDDFVAKLAETENATASPEPALA
jgi:hypothetical protein